MKIVVIGGTGRIGSKLVQILQAKGHDVLAAAPSNGVNATTGEGLDAALAGAHTVVDVSNSPSFEDGPVLAFFQSSSRNLVAAAQRAGVSHLVALSVVGADRIADSGYMRAKLAQERTLAAGGVPYSILRATQFHEFVGAIVEGSAVNGAIRLSNQPFQPIAAEDVVAALADVVLGAPIGGAVEVGGPEQIGLDEAGRKYLRSRGDAREVVSDPAATYFGAVLDAHTLVADAGARLGAIRLDDWLSQQRA